MRKPNSLRSTVRACLIFAACQSINAADSAAGKAKAAAVCQTCHGMNGKATMAMVANIGGQQQEYLVKQLRDFRAGVRQHPQMSIIAQSLSDQDIEDVSAWYASIIATFELPE